MESEDLFKKRRERTANDLNRKKPTRQNPAKQSQLRILIVCEDSKSSAFYLEELIKELGLTAVKVEGQRCGSAPSSVLGFAEDQYVKSKKDGDAYDKVYCVFDRDRHESFDETVQKISSLKPAQLFFATTTTPCFEFWLLLHFNYSAKAYRGTGNKSSCDNANTDLRVDYPEYGKNQRQIYHQTKHKLADAIAHAKVLAVENQKNDSTNPQTNMHELVEYLQSLTKNEIPKIK